jgi:haloacetate dehalogenase
MTIPGFAEGRIAVGPVALHVAIGGDGPPIVLLHGFPQDHHAWRHVAEQLRQDRRVVAIDLRGYGRSDRPDGGPEAYAKRVMAADVIGVLDHLGERRAAVVGHDRGALVAFRAALDHPDRVSHLGVFGVIPAIDLWDALGGVAGVFAWHLFFLAQPPDLPEQMIGADPARFFGHFLDTWLEEPDAIPADLRSAYVQRLRDPGAVRAVCDDYRASAFVDPADDRADREAGRRLAMPVLAAWEDPGDAELPFDPAVVWGRWAPDLETLVLGGGHFLAETRPDEVTAAIRRLLARPPPG